MLVRGDEGFHLPAQIRFGAGLVEIGVPLAGRSFKGASEHLLDFLPAFGRHVAPVLFNSRSIHAPGFACHP